MDRLYGRNTAVVFDVLNISLVELQGYVSIFKWFINETHRDRWRWFCGNQCR